MADFKRLNELIKSSGIKKGSLAQQMGISRQALGRKLTGKTKSFNVKEVLVLQHVLRLTNEEVEEIFLPNVLKK